MLRFGNIVWGSFQTPFFHTIKSLTWHIFKTQKSHGKRLRFTRNSELKGSFSQNTLTSIFF